MSVTQEEMIVKKCSFDKLIKYIKSDKVPKILNNACSFLVSMTDDGTIIHKVVNKKLPISSFTSMIIGITREEFHYDILYTDESLIIETRSPKSLSKYFEYYEKITFIKNEDPSGTVTITRKSETKKKNVDSSILNAFSSNPEDEFHFYSRKYIDILVKECI